MYRVQITDCSESSDLDVQGDSPSELQVLGPRGHLHVHARVRLGSAFMNLDCMLDSGAEVSIISPASAERCCPKGIQRLSNGDTTHLRMADGTTMITVRGVVHLWLSFGNQDAVRWKFLVAPLGVDALLGGDFFGQFGSTVNYSTMLFHLNPEHEGGT